MHTYIDTFIHTEHIYKQTCTYIQTHIHTYYKYIHTYYIHGIPDCE